MINKARMLDEFRRLSSFDSESFKERDIKNYLEEKLRSLGLEVESDSVGKIIGDNPKCAGNIYGFLKGNKKGNPILFSSHMDTVSPGVGKKMVVNGDTVTSDGTTVLGSDDITGLVSILEALEVIKEDNIAHPDIEVIFFVAEEPYCRGSSHFDFSKVKSKTAYVLDLSGEVGVAATRAPSIIYFRLEVKGRAAHAGFEPEKGISAIEVAAAAISRLKLGRIDDITTANIGIIKGGNGINIIPDNLYLEGEVRSLVHQNALGVLNSIKETFEGVSMKFGAAVSINVEERIHAYNIDLDSDVVKRYDEALKSLNYGKAKYITTFGGSDNNVLNLHGIKGIVISNAMNDVHTTNEYFSIKEFVKSANITLKLMTL